MPLHSVIIINSTGNILYSKYFQQYDVEKFAFEQSLHVNTSKVWTKGLCLTKQTVCLGGKYVVFQKLGELIFFVTGIEEVDEIILAELSETVLRLLKELLGSAITELNFLSADNYGKWTLLVDEMAPGGIIETMDADQIIRLSKLKYSK